MKPYNTLPNAKRILNNFRNKYDREIREVSSDLRPSYREKDGGYVYAPISEEDRQFIYGAIGTLAPEINSVTFDFDIENHFISPLKAINELKERRKLIDNDLSKLNELKLKYYNDKNGTTPWPIEVSIEYHQKVLDVIDVVLELPEVHEELNPGLIENYQIEIRELGFQLYWIKLKLKYSTQLLLYASLIFALIYYIINKDIYWYSSLFVSVLTLLHAVFLRINLIDSFVFLFNRNFKNIKKAAFISHSE